MHEGGGRWVGSSKVVELKKKYPVWKWITNKDLLFSTWKSAQCYVAAWIGGEFEGEWIHVYVWLSSFAVHLKLSQHCLLIGYIPIQNKKFLKK